MDDLSVFTEDDPADPTIESSFDAITSNVTTRAVFENAGDDESVTWANLEQRVFMGVHRLLPRLPSLIVNISPLQERDVISDFLSSQ